MQRLTQGLGECHCHLGQEHVAELKGKTIRKTPAPVVSDIIKVTEKITEFGEGFVLGFGHFLREWNSLSHHVEFEDLFHNSFKPEELENEDCGCHVLKHIYVYYFQQGF